MRREIPIILTILIFIAAFSPIIHAEEISSSSTEIRIITSDDFFTIQETIILQGTSDENIELVGFWIQDGAKDLKITVDAQNLEFEKSDNIYTTNLSTLEIKENSQPTFKIDYKIDKETDYFQKQIIRNTSSFEVTFDENILYESNNLLTGNSIKLYLIEATQTETTLSWYMILAIVLLLLLLVLVALNLIKKPKSEKVKKIATESEELLSTKKTLLMYILKDIEKKHRSKEISDDTYHKLKDYYKNEAVETMKKLEDISPKVK